MTDVIVLPQEVAEHMLEMRTAELDPYEADLLLARRWFEHANECHQCGDHQTGEYCTERGLGALDRVDDWVTKERRVAEFAPEATA